MATKTTKDNGGVVGKLAGKGEEALTRVMEGLGKNPRVTEALDRAMGAKGRLDDASRSALSQVGLAAAEEIRELRTQLERLERRLAKLEGESGVKTTAKRDETKTTPSAKRTTKSSSRAKETTDKAASPATGRSVGGGAARGGTP
jgi:polyhydroxyalkanoate synthesis regulator phasin